ncbi:hypothetical protein QNE88_000149 [Vibrio alginolyticus]|nr:hypothetical protein [Vibrio alginolyticus]ELB2808255.1 hypothetical protein [Vibrio alginolyticus]
MNTSTCACFNRSEGEGIVAVFNDVAYALIDSLARSVLDTLQTWLPH